MLVTTIFFAELPVVVIPRELLRSTPFIFSARLARVYRGGIAVGASCFLHEA
jgi:hypothetical protein